MARRRMKGRNRPVKKFTLKMKYKLFLLFGILILCLCALAVRIGYIDYTKGSDYRRIVLAQQAYDSTTIPFQRGSILDTNGTILATSLAVYNVVVDSYLVNYDYDSDKAEDKKKDYVNATLDAIDACFSDYYVDVKVDGETVPMDRAYLANFITNNPTNRYLVIAKQLTYEQISAFNDLAAENDAVVGVWFEKEYKRYYPFSNLASTILGFVSDGDVGTTGLENYYNDTLNGTNGREYGYMSDSSVEQTIVAAQDGNSLVLSLDANIQNIVETKILEFNEELTDNYREGDGSYNTAVLIMDPNTGEILAMADYPSYDCNNPRDISGLYSEEEREEMSDADVLETLNHLWQNYCVTSTYEPGSVQKALTISCGFETGTLTEDMTFLCDGSEQISGYTIHCVSRYGHGLETVRSALMDSCNDSLMQMSYLIGIDNFAMYQSIFNFGKKTGIDLPGEATAANLIYTADNMTAIDLATNAFGQNFNCTMIQMASAYASIINGGTYYQPHLVRKITDADGNTVETIGATVLKETISQSTSDILRDYLGSVVSEGTGSYAKVDGYSMGGKTGTAEKSENGTKSDVDYVVSFLGFVPLDNPQLLIYAVVDSPNVEDQAHSSYAQHLVREILKEVLPYLNIFPDEELTGANAQYDIVGNYAEVGTSDTADTNTSDTTDTSDTGDVGEGGNETGETSDTTDNSDATTNDTTSDTGGVSDTPADTTSDSGGTSDTVETTDSDVTTSDTISDTGGVSDAVQDDVDSDNADDAAVVEDGQTT